MQFSTQQHFHPPQNIHPQVLFTFINTSSPPLKKVSTAPFLPIYDVKLRRKNDIHTISGQSFGFFMLFCPFLLTQIKKIKKTSSFFFFFLTITKKPPTFATCFS